jgi:hypothetical protein
VEVIAKSWLSVADAARLFEYNSEYVRQLVRAGHVRAKRVARMIYVERASLAAYRRTKVTQDVPRPAAKRLGKPHMTTAEAVHSNAYFTNLAVRRVKNQSAIVLLDQLAHVDETTRAEQKRAGDLLERAYLAERPHLKPSA